MLCLTLVFLQGCKVRTPRGILDERNMTALLEDYHKAQIMAEVSGGNDSTKELYTEAVLNKYGMTREQFNENVRYYARHSDKLYDIYDAMVQNAGKTSDTGGEGEEKGQSVNASITENHSGRDVKITNLPPCMLCPADQRYDFTVTDKDLAEGDSIELHFNTRFIYKEGARSAYAMMVVRYSADSVATVAQSVYGDGDNVMTLVLPVKSRTGNTTGRAYSPRSVEGYIYLDIPSDAKAKMLFVSRIAVAHIKAAKKNPENKTASKNDTTSKDTAEQKKEHFIDSLRENKSGKSHWK